MKVQASHTYATGRRKRSVARVYLQSGSGKIEVNGKPANEYFGERNDWVAAVSQPLEAVGVADQFDVIVRVKGGGNTGQSGAILLGVARALDKYELDTRPDVRRQVAEAAEQQAAAAQANEGSESEAEVVASTEVPQTWHQILRSSGYLTRDARQVERKLPGLAKARRAKQFSKR